MSEDPTRPNVYSIPPGQPFVDSLARGIRELVGHQPDALTGVSVLLPTRRACRAMRDAFLRANDGVPVLLPRLLPLGDLDEDELLIGASGLMGEEAGLGGDHALSIPPAIPGLRRQLLLTRLILARPDQDMTPDQAARLAQELARLLDQVHTERGDFSNLADLVPEDFASHWQLTLDFLALLTDVWPGLLAAEGCLDPADRRNRLLETRARLWRNIPPEHQVIAAGSTGSIPATAELLSVIARLPRGMVVLPGLDQNLDPEAWHHLNPVHPQFGMAQLLDLMEVPREDVIPWPATSADESERERERLINAALTPAALPPATINTSSRALDGVSRVDCPGPREEAAAIALIMREALEIPGQTATLVTPDRGLARRVTAALKRWRIVVDDSAGVPLNQTPPGAFLRLVADAATENLAPVPLLALLKHPLAAAGYATQTLRRLVRRLEILVLRGPRPASGVDGLRAALAGAGDRNGRGDGGEPDLMVLIDRIAAALDPIVDWDRSEARPLNDFMQALINAAEAMAATATEAGPERLWAGDAGQHLAAFTAEVLESGDTLTVQARRFAALVETLMAGRVVRPRFGAHPRLSILGPLEARLQSADVLILGGLNEGTWPPETPPSPWMSRPMMANFGLPQPERRIGLSAHDFVQGVNAPTVVMTRAERVDGTPTVPCRWLRRIDNLLNRQGRPEGLPGTMPWLDWVNALDRTEISRAAPPPRPTPPPDARPKQLSVTQIETLIRDPYAVYARHILKLRPLDPLDADPGAADRGIIIHGALDEFIATYPDDLPRDAERRLLEIGAQHFGSHLSRPGVRAFWWPRFERIAHWFINNERTRRKAGWRTVATEAKGRLTIDGLRRPFTLTARADRIDYRADVGLSIIDYKTGKPPSNKQVAAGLAPQLPLEAAIANAGGFADVGDFSVANLSYMWLSGGREPGKEMPVKLDLGETLGTALSGLSQLVHVFEDPETPYLSQPRPMYESRFGDYDHLARVKEWRERRRKT